MLSVYAKNFEEKLDEVLSEIFFEDSAALRNIIDICYDPYGNFLQNAKNIAIKKGILKENRNFIDPRIAKAIRSIYH